MIRAVRLALVVLLGYWTFRFIAYPMREDVIGSSVVHLPDLIFHEAGHILFSPFGDFLTTLGGSLLQVIVPIVCGVAFLTTNRDLFGAAVMAWWTGQNLLDVAIYINDARALQLTLIGGHTGAEVEGHDWERILTMTNALHLDHRIAMSVQVAGALLMAAGLVCAGVIATRNAAT
jgi:hypothetical protein